MTACSSFAHAVRAIWQNSGLRQEEFAERVGYRRSTVANIMRGWHLARLEFLDTVEDAFLGSRQVLEPAVWSPTAHRSSNHVSIDFAGLSGETLHGVMQKPLDKVRGGGRAPESITTRALLPDTSSPMALPCRTDDLVDDPDFHQRAGQSCTRCTT